jgi:biotin--protein ligase
VSKILDSLASPKQGSQLIEFKDANDHFRFLPFSDRKEALHEARSQNPPERPTQPIIICPDGQLPERHLTPLFNLGLYYELLSEARKRYESLDVPDTWAIGDTLLYGEVVTSTQTLLEKNPAFVSKLQPPIVSLASHQLSGRGRGTNVWYSPSGCLQFSLLLRVSLSEFPANKLVFVQYLFALAVVEACRDDGVLGEHAERVKLKWPNDLYAIMGEERKKIGGILVNTSFMDGKVDIVIGCGLNVLNPPPLGSLSQLAPERALSMERVSALIMARFAPMWNLFVGERGSFEPFIKLYLDRWMHSNQVITLTMNPPRTLRIVGLALDHGLLRTVAAEKEGNGGEFVDIQPDLNSFDVMAGIIKGK